MTSRTLELLKIITLLLTIVGIFTLAYFTQYAFHKKDLTKDKAADLTNSVTALNLPSQMKYAPNELIIKYKTSLSTSLKVETNINSIDAATLPKSLSETKNILKIKSISKVFPNAEAPAVELAKYKEVFKTELADGSLSIDEQNMLATDLTRTYKITLEKGVNLENAIKELNKYTNEIEYVTPNYLAAISATLPTPSSNYPNDPYFNQQWSHKLTKAQAGWKISKGDPKIQIAVLDTGVYFNHPDLALNMASDCTNGCPSGKGYDFVDIDINSYKGNGYDVVLGEDYIQIDNMPSDVNGHGTHVAGIAAAKTNNSIGVAGTCPNCKILPVRAGFSIKYAGNIYGVLEYDDIASGIYYITNKTTSRIISMSFGGEYDSPLLREALSYAYSQGRVLIAAAGNLGPAYPYPAYYPEVLSVAATNQSDQVAWFSTTGYWVDVAAPGENILSTYIPDSNNPSRLYETLSGTSMSTPYISGVAGLILSANIGNLRASELSPSKVYQAIRQGVDNPIKTTHPQSSKFYFGTGRINVKSALEANTAMIAKIISPDNGTKVISNDTVSLKGTAKGTCFSGYQIFVGNDIYPDNKRVVYQSNKAVNNDVLYTFKPATIFKEGFNTIYLKVNSACKASSAQDQLLMFSNLIDIQDPANDEVYRSGSVIDIIGRISITNPTSVVYEYKKSDSTSWSSNGITPVNSENIFAKWDTNLLPDKTGKYDFRLSVSSDNSTIQVLSKNIYFDDTLKKGWPIKLNYEYRDLTNPSQNSSNLIPNSKVMNNSFVSSNSISSFITSETTNRQKTVYLSTQTSREYFSVGKINTVVDDLDNDGIKEIVFIKGGYSPKIVVYDNNGNLKFSKEIGDPGFYWIGNIATPLIVDLNKDNKKEIVTCYYTIYQAPCSTINAYSYNGQLVWSTGIPPSFHVNFSAADLDNDNNPEIIIKNSWSLQHQIIILRNDGSNLKTFSYWDTNNAGEIEPSVAVGNFDQDLDLELVVAASEYNGSGKIAIYNTDGTVLPGWPKSIDSFIFSSPVIADLDNDTKLEIVVGTYTGGLYVFKQNGEIMPNSPILKGSTIWSTPAIGNFDEDPSLEIAISYYWGITTLIDHQGLTLPGWPVHTPYNDNDSIVTADINNDGKLEIITVAGDISVGGGLYAWNSQGQTVSGFPRLIGGIFNESQKTITDLENDDKLEIITSSGFDIDYQNFTSKLRGSLYVWELNSPNNTNSNSWPVFHHDLFNTGNYHF